MRKLFVTFALLCAPCFATLQGGIQWDIRSGGSSTNGGGFDPTVTIPGQDYSQQNSAQVTYTDLTIQATTTQVRSAGNPFATCSAGSGYCGNIIHVSSAVSGSCTAGWYEITSITTITATLDRAPGTSGSVCNAVLGGSLSAPADPMGFIVNGNTVWLKGGGTTYTITSNIIPTNNGVGMSIIGYNSTHGDIVTTGDANRPTITTSTNSVNLITGGPANNGARLQNLKLTNTAVTPGNGFTPNATAPAPVSNCSFSGFNIAINDASNQPSLWLQDSDISASVKAIDHLVGGAVVITNSVITGMTGTGANPSVNIGGSGGTSFSMTNTLVVNGSGVGVHIATNQAITAIITNSTIANNSGNGLDIGGSSLAGFGRFLLQVENNIFYGNGGYGAEGFQNGLPSGAYVSTSLPAVYFHHNAWGGNTNGAYLNISAGTGDVTLSADPFTSSGTGDYSLNSTAGGGAALKGTGYPGVFPGGTTTGYSSFGAVDPLSCGGGGGGASPTACAFSMLRRPR